VGDYRCRGAGVVTAAWWAAYWWAPASVLACLVALAVLFLRAVAEPPYRSDLEPPAVERVPSRRWWSWAVLLACLPLGGCMFWWF
jgi:hypothetical protein